MTDTDERHVWSAVANVSFPAARHDLLTYLTDRPTMDPSALQALSTLPDREFTSPANVIISIP